MSELRTNRIVPRDGLVSGTGKAGGVIQVVSALQQNYDFHITEFLYQEKLET